jgi:hypothetical protein
MPVSTNTCLYCERPITNGRSDKKFCNEGCKDACYIAQKSEQQQEISKIDTVLKRDRSILKRLFKPDRETIVQKDTLLQAGFNFGFHTHFIFTHYKANQYCFF